MSKYVGKRLEAIDKRHRQQWSSRLMNKESDKIRFNSTHTMVCKLITSST
jgi:hypothetical protein